MCFVILISNALDSPVFSAAGRVSHQHKELPNTQIQGNKACPCRPTTTITNVHHKHTNNSVKKPKVQQQKQQQKIKGFTKPLPPSQKPHQLSHAQKPKTSICKSKDLQMITNHS